LQLNLLEPTEDMALSNSDKDWIRQTIEESNRFQGWARVRKIAREWSLLGVATALLIFFLTQWGGYVEFRTHTDDRLKIIEAKVSVWDFQSHARMPLEEFQKTLPDLKSAAKEAKEHNIKVPSGTLDNLQRKLQDTGTDAPDYWATIAAFINYRSFASVTPSDFRDLTRPDLPNCLDHFPTPGRITGSGGNTTTFTNSHYDNCRITLDSPHDDDVINAIEFKNMPSTLVSPGHPNIPVVFSGKTLNFEGCLFDLEITKAPPSPGSQITQALLAQNDLAGTINLPLK